MLNTKFKESGRWPTIGEAVESGERVFVFVRSELVGPKDLEIVQEVKGRVSPEYTNYNKYI
jgi:predicted deacylase